MENLLPQICGVIYKLLVVMLSKQPIGRLPVAVDHSQLRTMVSENVDPIDWPLPPTLHKAVPPQYIKSVQPLLARDSNVLFPHVRQPP